MSEEHAMSELGRLRMFRDKAVAFAAWCKKMEITMHSECDAPIVLMAEPFDDFKMACQREEALALIAKV